MYIQLNFFRLNTSPCRPLPPLPTMAENTHEHLLDCYTRELEAGVVSDNSPADGQRESGGSSASGNAPVRLLSEEICVPSGVGMELSQDLLAPPPVLPERYSVENAPVVTAPLKNALRQYAFAKETPLVADLASSASMPAPDAPPTPQASPAPAIPSTPTPSVPEVVVIDTPSDAPSPIQEQEHVMGYVKVRIPPAKREGLALKSCVCHRDLLKAGARGGDVVSWGDVDFRKAILIISKENGVVTDHGLTSRMLLEDQGQYVDYNIVDISHVQFLHPDIMPYMQTQLSAPKTNVDGRVKHHDLDKVVIALFMYVRPHEEVPEYLPAYLTQLVKDGKQQQQTDDLMQSFSDPEDCLVTRLIEEEEEEIEEQTAATSAKHSARGYKYFTEPTTDVINLNAITLDDSDVDDESSDITMPCNVSYPLPSKTVKSEPASQINYLPVDTVDTANTVNTANTQRNVQQSPNGIEEIDVDAEEEGSGGGGSEQNGGTWRTRAGRLSRKKGAHKANPLFLPDVTLKERYPCTSVFHSRVVKSNQHASRQCPYCASCHWMETLFHNKDAYCCWKHEPSLIKINRSPLSEADKKQARDLFNNWRHRMEVERRALGGEGVLAADGTVIKQERPVAQQIEDDPIESESDEEEPHTQLLRLPAPQASRRVGNTSHTNNNNHPTQGTKRRLVIEDDDDEDDRLDLGLEASSVDIGDVGDANDLRENGRDDSSSELDLDLFPAPVLNTIRPAKKRRINRAAITDPDDDWDWGDG